MREEKYCISLHLSTLSEYIYDLKIIPCNITLFYRVQTFSRMQLLQEFDSRCQALAAKNNRGFKQEFEVTIKLRNWIWIRFMIGEAGRVCHVC